MRSKRDRVNPVLTKTCVWCGGQFITRRKTAKFCSGKCRFADYNYEHPRTPRANRVSNEPVSD